MKRRHLLSVTAGGIASLAGCLGDTEYRVTDVTVPEQAEPLFLNVSVLDESVNIESPARLEISLENQSDTAVEIRTTGVTPFGVLAVGTMEEEGSDQILLYTDAYEQTDRVQVSKTGVRLNNDPIIETLSPGQSVTEEFHLSGENLFREGTYNLRGYHEPEIAFFRRSETEDWTEFSPAVTLELREQSLRP